MTKFARLLKYLCLQNMPLMCVFKIILFYFLILFLNSRENLMFYLNDQLRDKKFLLCVHQHKTHNTHTHTKYLIHSWPKTHIKNEK